jgi:hypothetical protein
MTVHSWEVRESFPWGGDGTGPEPQTASGENFDELHIGGGDTLVWAAMERLAELEWWLQIGDTTFLIELAENGSVKSIRVTETGQLDVGSIIDDDGNALCRIPE